MYWDHVTCYVMLQLASASVLLTPLLGKGVTIVRREGIGFLNATHASATSVLMSATIQQGVASVAETTLRDTTVKGLWLH